MNNNTSHPALLSELRRLVGASQLLTDAEQTARYRKGFRSGEGDALAVVFPGSCWSYGACCRRWFRPMPSC